MILTAAHCNGWFTVIDIDRYDFGDLQDTYSKHTVKNISSHPLFDLDYFRYDFAVVQMNDSVLNVYPVVLNSDPAVPVLNESLTVVGWGATEIDLVNGPVYPNIFQKGTVYVLSNLVCANTVIKNQTLYKGEIYNEMLCAQAPGVDACTGDSGGPLFIEGSSKGLDLQVGLVSWGRGCAVYPGVYSRISAGYDWIRGQVCYKSVDPPSYMQCQNSERDPKYVTTDVKTATSAGATTAPNSTSNSTPTGSPSVAARIRYTESPSINKATQKPLGVQSSTPAPITSVHGTAADKLNEAKGASSAGNHFELMRWFWKSLLFGSAVWLFR